jgi:acetyl esterase/lipase
MPRSLLAQGFALLVCFHFAFAAAPSDSTAPDKAKREYGWNMTLDRIPKDMKVQDGIVYKTVGGKDLVMVMFLPKEKKYDKAPVMVYIHGGGFGHGNRFVVEASGGIDVVRQLNDAGVICVSIEYRLVTGPGPLTGMDQVADCEDAIHFLVKNKDRFGIDPNRIATMGGSAGGTLSLITALGDDKDYPCDPQLAPYHGKVLVEVADFPLVSVLVPALLKGSNWDNPIRMIPLLGGPIAEKHDVAVKLSALSLLKPTSPAIFTAQGDKDVVLNPGNAPALAAACKEKGVPCELLVVKNAGHGFSGTNIDPPMAEISRRSADFVLKYLLPPGK